uniref:Emerin n=1 Tax=Sphenodon punctatus TaxID=8508 RepID=A0A8D0L8B1_SPHPU
MPPPPNPLTCPSPLDWDGDVSEDSYSSSRLYGAALSSGGHLGAATTRQPIGELLYSAARQEATATGRDSGTYQSVWQRQAPSPASSLGLQPRRAIRPELQTPAAAGGGSGAGSRRFLPLWLQLLVFLLLAAFLGYAYFYLQGGDDNPFRPYLQN